MSVDRYLTVRIQTWKNTYMTTGRALCLGYSLFIVIILLQSNVLFTFGHEKLVNNNTVVVQCYHSENISSTKWMSIWGSVSNLLVFNEF